MLFDGSLSIFSMPSLKWNIKHFNFRSKIWLDLPVRLRPWQASLQTTWQWSSCSSKGADCCGLVLFSLLSLYPQYTKKRIALITGVRSTMQPPRRSWAEIGQKNRTGSRVNILKGCVNPKWPNTNLSERSAIILEYYLKCFSKYQILVKARRVPPSHSDANNCGLCFHLGTTIVVKAENLWRTRARARKQRGRGGLRGNGRRRRGKPSGKRSRKTQRVSVFPF